MNKTRLLFIDDEEVNRINFQQAFSDDYDVLLAASGKEALELLAANEDIALILSDQRMPEMSGAELLARAREILPNAERIILTAYSQPEDIIAAINQGEVYRYILKPWSDAELRIAIMQAIERFQLKQENRSLLFILEEKNDELAELVKARTDELTKLQSMLPICSYCRRIRDDKNAWHELEVYLRLHSEIHFTHGICPHCYEMVMKEHSEIMPKKDK